MPYALSILFVIGLSFLLFIPEQSDFTQIFPVYAILFVIYIYLFKSTTTKVSLRFLISLGVLCRLIAVFSFPNLSDDIYRFIWDGSLSFNGINPFKYLPSQMIDLDWLGMKPDLEIYENLNSKNYYSVYPPFSQAIFFVCHLLSGESIFLNSVFLKLFMVMAECGSIYLLLKILAHFKKPLGLSIIYVLNPLVIIETCGNIHFEAIMVFFFLLFIWAYIKSRKSQAMLWLGISIATKLIPLIILPFLLRHLGLKQFLKYGSLLLGILLLLFAPVYLAVNPSHFLDSIDLYFRSFEFNASVYYILRFVGYQLSGYNLISWIGPGLAILTFALILNQAYRVKSLDSIQEIFPNFLMALTTYLFLSTTIHPWYLVLPICITVFTGSKYILVWSLLIFLTYINYSYPVYQENFWLVALEYGMVIFVFILEKKKKITELTLL